MSSALVISLGAVAMSLFAVFIALRGAKTKSRSNSDGGTASSDGSSDCSPSDGGGCDGGGGGD